MEERAVAPEDAEAILLAEDDDVMRELLQMLLEGQGYRVVVTRNGTEALEAYRHYGKTIRVVISDIEMPGLNGAELCWQIKKLNPLVHVIFISGYFDPQAMQEFRKVGVRHFIQKPFSPDAIMVALHDVFASSKGSAADTP